MKSRGGLSLLLGLFLMPVLTEAQSYGANQTNNFGTVHTVPWSPCKSNCPPGSGYVSWGYNTNYGTTYQLYSITSVTGFDFSLPDGAGPPNFVAGGSAWSCTVEFNPARAGTYSGTITLDYIAQNTGKHLLLTVAVSGTYAP
jgi:hypothetical protein